MRARPFATVVILSAHPFPVIWAKSSHQFSVPIRWRARLPAIGSVPGLYVSVWPLLQEVSMTEVQKHQPGMFCWVELAAKDGPAAKKFYKSLFDWGVDDIPNDAGVYSMVQKKGKNAGGLYEQ